MDFPLKIVISWSLEVSVKLLLYKKEKKTLAINKGYLTAKTDKASDEVYTPEYAVLPLVKYI